MGRVDGKVAIVTGAAQGMGEAFVRRLVKEGAKVVFTDVQKEKGEKIAQELGPNAKFIQHDVTSESDWAMVVSETEKAFGPITILVNNAGVCPALPISAHPIEDFKRTLDINLTAHLIGMKTVYPSMRGAGGGSIVNISSQSGFVGGPYMAAYTASKFGVRGLTKVAAVEFGPDNIRVNSVHPGVVLTPMTNAPDILPFLEAAAKNNPLGRIGKPDELANLVLYLASDESSYSTGSEFIADGGALTQNK